MKYPKSRPPSQGRRAFSTRRPVSFYLSLLLSRKKAAAVLLLLILVYSAFSALRLGAVGFVLDCVRVHLERAHSDQAPTPAKRGGAAASSVEAFESVWKQLLPERYPPITHDLGSTEGFQHVLLVLAGVLLAISLGQAGSFFLRETIAHRTFVSLVATVRSTLFNYLTRQSLAYFHQRRTGDLISRATNDVAAIQVALRNMFETLWQPPAVMLSSLGVAIWASPFLFLLSLPIFILLAIPAIRSGRQMQQSGRGRQQRLGEITESLQELFSGIRVVKAFGMEQYEQDAFAKKNQAFGRAFRRLMRARTMGRTFQELLFNVGFIALFLLGSWLISEPGSTQISVGRFFTFVLAMGQVYAPLRSFSMAWTVIQESVPSVERILEVLRDEPTIQDKPGAREFSGGIGCIRFENVTFSYEKTHGKQPSKESSTVLPAVRDVSLEVKAGQVVAIVGPSGSGKTTLVDLLARFHDPQAGRITIDGTDIRAYRLSSYLHAIAIVSQEPFLFNTSILENIRYGKIDATDTELITAAKAANAHEFIMEQPAGYHTVVGDRGVMLSGGQRQRLTIARAILKGASILILDEATSSLDNESEQEVQKAINNLIKERTTFVIAHRLSTIQGADMIVVLDKGRIVGSGRHKDLLANVAQYSRLYNLQKSEPASLVPEKP